MGDTTKNLDSKKLENILQSNIFNNRKEEIFQLEIFIHKYHSDNSLDYEAYSNIFDILVQEKLNCINDRYIKHIINILAD